MRKAFALLALLAVGLAGLAAILVQQPVHYGASVAAPKSPGDLSVPYVFSAGLVIGASLMWMYSRRRIAVVRAQLGWRHSWTRRFAVVGLAAIAAGYWLYA